MRNGVQTTAAIAAIAMALAGCQGLPMTTPARSGVAADPPVPAVSQAGVCRPHQRPPQCIAFGETPRRSES